MNKAIDKAEELLWVIPGMALFMTAFASGLAAIVVFAYRAFAYAKLGVWSRSLCDLTRDGLHRGDNFPDACVTFNTSWIGVNEILHWLFWDVDASLGFLIIGGLCAAIFIAMLLSMAYLYKDRRAAELAKWRAQFDEPAA